MIKYDFSNIEKVFYNIKLTSKPTPNELNILRREINKFYDDVECTQIIFTNNTDKQFFGMCVYPITASSDAIKIIEGEESRALRSYVLELDSKLFNEVIDFTPRELTAILLHEIGHIMNDNNNLKKISNYINAYQGNTNTSLNIRDIVMYPELFLFVFKRTLRQLGSIFEKDKSEFEADRISVEYGYGNDLETAFAKIIKMRGTSLTVDKDKFINLKWFFITYNQLTKRKKNIVRLLQDMGEYSGSKLEKEAFKKLQQKLRDDNKIVIENLKESGRNYITESVKKSSFLSRVKTKGLKAIEDDMYVYKVRIKNIESETEAMDILRDINVKINIVEDYIANEELSDNEYQRWDTLRIKLRELREDITSKPTYRAKYWSMWMEMPITARQL